MGRLNPSRETRFSGANADRGILFFPVQLTTSRIGNLTRLIYILLYVMTIRIYIHTYIHDVYSSAPLLPRPSLSKNAELSRCRQPHPVWFLYFPSLA